MGKAVLAGGRTFVPAGDGGHCHENPFLHERNCVEGVGGQRFIQQGEVHVTLLHMFPQAGGGTFHQGNPDIGVTLMERGDGICQYTYRACAGTANLHLP